MTPQEKYDIIAKDLLEIVGEDDLKEILKKKDLSLYWGTAPTGKPHLGYFVPIFKIADFLNAGCHVTILFADIHAYLDNMKTTWALLDKRTKYYEFLIREMLKLVGVSLDKLKFVKGTDFQLSDMYTMDMYRISALTSTRDTQRAGAEVVKQIVTPKISGLLYPILQALDEEYLKVDAQFGGIDQRKIFVFAREFLPKIGYKKRVHLMNPLIPGLGESGKMSSSEPNSKIDFDDDEKTVRKKINKAFCADGIVENNGLLAILKNIIFKKLEHEGREFVVDRPEKYGGKITFKSYETVEKAFKEKKLSSIDLKASIVEEILSFLKPLHKQLEKHKKLLEEAYPKE